jgi:hypothetical protein
MRAETVRGANDAADAQPDDLGGRISINKTHPYMGCVFCWSLYQLADALPPRMLGLSQIFTVSVAIK